MAVIYVAAAKWAGLGILEAADLLGFSQTTIIKGLRKRKSAASSRRVDEEA